MPVYRTYQCPECEKCFDFLHHPINEPPPSFCPLCGSDVSGKKKQKRVKQVDNALSPNIKPRAPRTGIASKSADGLYRQMESASENRMQDAATLLGCDVSSLASMKMTDMKDNLKQGDMSMATTPSAATSLTGNVQGSINGAVPGAMTFQSRTDGAEYAKAVGQGPHAFAGNKIRETVVSGHAMRAANTARAGQINKK